MGPDDRPTPTPTPESCKENLTTTRTAHHPRPQTSAPEEALDIQTPVKAKMVPSVVAPLQHAIFRSPDHTLTVSNLTFLVTTKCLFITNVKLKTLNVD
ncbi:hypothetical protein RUM44_004577 [Polyplax serrata]|uniref:Uncharacterized protein n=1 Tax=Polyplax serrata TaxID=468196 RepID=A0ABR1B384_POLSC